ncbi:MAG: TIGR04551 family protein [Polyangiaceae bacterium]|nr:TIGR04551 family protein [Polyangiaceae bacterium]
MVKRRKAHSALLIVFSASVLAFWVSIAAAQEPAPAEPARAAEPAQPAEPPTKPSPPEAAPPAAATTPKVDATARDNTGTLMPSELATTPPGTRPAIDPTSDQQKLMNQGQERPFGEGWLGGRSSEIYSEDWWGHTRPTIEMHGYFRTRGELFHNFALGRHDDPTLSSAVLWAQPLDQSYTQLSGLQRQVLLCGSDGNGTCNNKSQATANLRLRLNPEIHISDNLRILTQIDLLDNLVLGSTPNAYAMKPGSSKNGYVSAGYNAYAPLGFFSTTQGSPTAGVNSYQNAINVQRVWAEYLTPIGQLRFGRMPDHWGLGMVANSGDCIDCDYQSNIDRIMFVSGIKSLDLYFGGAWDFISSGPTSASAYDVYGGQPYNTSNLNNVNQWAAFVAKRTNPDLQRMKLARNEVVLNAGLYTTYRSQYIDVQAGQTPITFDSAANNNGMEARRAWAITPDVWIQFLWNKLRVEAELATIWGSLGYSPAGTDISDPIKLRQWGLATQTEYRAVEDKLRVQFGFGWASGDPNAEGLAPSSNGLQPSLSPNGSMTTFRFNPAYMVDYIFFRKILTRVEGAYYFRPSVEYDFLRNPNGQKFGGSAAVIWSRASEFMQTPGNKRDLGVELDAQIYYQSKDGSLNDNPDKMGGFYAALQYGVFFPLGGLDYLPGVQGTLTGTSPTLPSYNLSTAQTVRLILGVLF